MVIQKVPIFSPPDFVINSVPKWLYCGNCPISTKQLKLLRRALVNRFLEALRRHGFQRLRSDCAVWIVGSHEPFCMNMKTWHINGSTQSEMRGFRLIWTSSKSWYWLWLPIKSQSIRHHKYFRSIAFELFDKGTPAPRVALRPVHPLCHSTRARALSQLTISHYELLISVS